MVVAPCQLLRVRPSMPPPGDGTAFLALMVHVFSSTRSAWAETEWARTQADVQVLTFSSQPGVPANMEFSEGCLDSSKTQLALAELQRQVPSAAWYMKADDDTFIFVQKLVKWLRQQSETQHNYFGAITPHGNFFSGGGGYIISQKTMTALNSPHAQPGCNKIREEMAPEDYWLYMCLHNVLGVQGKSVAGMMWSRPDMLIHESFFWSTTEWARGPLTYHYNVERPLLIPHVLHQVSWAPGSTPYDAHILQRMETCADFSRKHALTYRRWNTTELFKEDMVSRTMLTVPARLSRSQLMGLKVIYTHGGLWLSPLTDCSTAAFAAAFKREHVFRNPSSFEQRECNMLGLLGVACPPLAIAPIAFLGILTNHTAAAIVAAPAASPTVGPFLGLFSDVVREYDLPMRRLPFGAPQVFSGLADLAFAAGREAIVSHNDLEQGALNLADAQLLGSTRRLLRPLSPDFPKYPPADAMYPAMKHFTRKMYWAPIDQVV